MSKVNDGGPAYPTPNGGTASDGLSLLDWFAGQAMSGFCSESAETAHVSGDWEGGKLKDVCIKSTVRESYRIAMAMLAERERIMKS